MYIYPFLLPTTDIYLYSLKVKDVNSWQPILKSYDNSDIVKFVVDVIFNLLVLESIINVKLLFEV